MYPLGKSGVVDTSCHKSGVVDTSCHTSGVADTSCQTMASGMVDIMSHVMFSKSILFQYMCKEYWIKEF